MRQLLLSTYAEQKPYLSTVNTNKDQPLFPDSPTVNVVYATALQTGDEKQTNQVIIILQSKVSADFALLPYIEKRDKTSTNEIIKIAESLH